MRAFEDLAEWELCTLSDEETTRYLDLACAEAGVALLPAMPIPPGKSAARADLTVYVLGGFEFTERAEALAVLAAVHAARSYGDTRVVGGNYNAGYKWLPLDSGTVTISERQAISPDVAAREEDAIVRHAEQKTVYDNLQSEYTAIEHKRNEIRKNLSEKINAARAVENRRARLRFDHARYLELAGGLRRVAARFLQAAHPDAPTLVPEAFEFAGTDPADPKARAYFADEAPRAAAPVATLTGTASDIPF